MIEYTKKYFFTGLYYMNYAKFSVGDVLVMKKKHPCSSERFKVLRGGSDVRIVCLGCERDLTLQRETLEKSIKRVEPGNDAENTAQND